MFEMAKPMDRSSKCFGMIGLQHGDEGLEHRVLDARVLRVRGGMSVAAVVVIRDGIPEHEGAALELLEVALEDVGIQPWNGVNAGATLGPRDRRIPNMAVELVSAAGAEDVMNSLGDLFRSELVKQLARAITELCQERDRLARLYLHVLLKVPIPFVVDFLFGPVVEDESDDLLIACVAKICHAEVGLLPNAARQ